jgi:hypothetical protein
LDYRGARYYDSEYGRFLSVDPEANIYPSISSYVYVADNPIIFVDPDGKKIKFADKFWGSLDKMSKGWYWKSWDFFIYDFPRGI